MHVDRFPTQTNHCSVGNPNTTFGSQTGHYTTRFFRDAVSSVSNAELSSLRFAFGSGCFQTGSSRKRLERRERLVLHAHVCISIMVNFRKSCMQRLRVAYNFGCRATCPGERVLVATKFNVTFPPLRLCYVNTSTCSSKDAENLTTYGYVLWCNQIVCIRP